MQHDRLEGGCACGVIRYRLLSAPMFVQCCHCRDCQRQVGSAFVVNALIETDRIEVEGAAPEAVSVPTASSRPHDVYRCTVCRTALWSDYGRRPTLRFVRVCTLDDPSVIAPAAHIFTRSKLPWFSLPHGIPAFPIYYDMGSLWPKESIERRRAILGDV